MLCDYSFLLLPVLALVSHVNAASTEIGAGCTFGPTVESDSYFVLVAYPYPVTNSVNYQDANFVANGYTSYSENSVSIDNMSDYNQQWELASDVLHFILQFTGYFRAPETGVYIVHVSIEAPYDQESVMVWLGSDMAFGCCQQQIPPDSANGSLIFASSLSTYDGYVVLEEDVYYPMRIVMGSVTKYGQFDLSMDTPSGGVIENVSDNIFQMYDSDSDCTPVSVASTTSGYIAASTTSEYTAATLYWTGSNTFTSTYVFTTTDSSSNVHVVTESAEVVPAPPVFTANVPSTTTVVTQYTAIDTTLGATPYVTIGDVVLVPMSSATSSTSTTASSTSTTTTSSTSTTATSSTSTTVTSTTSTTSTPTPSYVDCSGLSGLDKAECMNENFDNGYYLGSADSCVDGQIACNADHDFAICDYGEWVVMDCAPGTSCFAFNFGGGEEVTVGCNFTEDMDEYEDDDENENADPEAS